MKYSILVPVYKNEAGIPELVQRLHELHEKLEFSCEAVLVVDGSPDNSYELLRRALPQTKFSSQLILHSRNFGSFAAIRTGLEVARGKYFVVMSDDLQEPAELIVQLLKTIETDQNDIGIGTRLTRADSISNRVFSWIFWRLYRMFVQKGVPPGGVDIFSCNSKVRDVLLKLRETNTSLVGLLFWIGFRRSVVPYDRQIRKYGKSGWSFSRRLKYFMDSCFGFTDLPINILILVGIVGIIGSLTVTIIVLLAYLLGQIPTPGYVPIMLGILFSCALNLFAVGIVGAYIWRSFENTKGRPLSIAMLHDTFNSEN